MHSKVSWSRIALFALEHGAATRDGGSSASLGVGGPVAAPALARPSSRKTLLLCVAESSARALADTVYQGSAESGTRVSLTPEAISGLS